MKKILLILISIVCGYYGNTQDVVFLNESFSAPFEQAEKDSLAVYADDIKINLNDSVDFKIIIGTYYQLSEHMGDTWQDLVFDNFQNEANGISANNLLIAKLYDKGSNSFKLRYKLNIRPEDLFCFDWDKVKEIEDLLTNAEAKIGEYYSLLSGGVSDISNDNLVKLGRYASQIIFKICCELSSNRTSCSEEFVDDFMIAAAKFDYYYLIGRIKCFCEYTCTGGVLENNDPLLELTNFSSFPVQMPLFGYVQVNVNINVNEVDCCSEAEETSITIYGGKASHTRDAFRFNLGRFTLTTTEKDFFTKLSKLYNDTNANLSSIMNKVIARSSITNYEKNILEYVSLCEVQNLQSSQKKLNFIFDYVLSLNKPDYQGNPIIESVFSYWRRHTLNRHDNLLYNLFESVSADEYFKEIEYNKEKVFNIVDLLEFLENDNVKVFLIANYLNKYYERYFNPQDSFFKGRSYENSPIIIYDVEKVVGFEHSNYFIEYNTTNIPWVTILKNLNYGFNTFNGFMNFVYGTGRKSVIASKIDPLDPVITVGVFASGADIEKPQVFPATLLVYREKTKEDANFWNAVNIAVDVVTTFSVVGNVSKAKYLSKLGKGIIYAELSATLANNIVRYTEIAPASIRNKLIIFFSIVEVTSAVASFDTRSFTKMDELMEELYNHRKVIDPNEIHIIDDVIETVSATIGHGRAMQGRLSKIIDVNSDLYKWLSKVNDPKILAGLGKLSDDALFEVSKVLNEAKIIKFADNLNDVHKGANLIDFFNTNAQGVKAWEKLFVNQAWRTHIPSLSKTSRYLENGLELETVGNKIIVKQNGVQLGELNKLDANDVYFPDQLMVKAQVNPGRHFDPDLAGGPIVKKTWDNPTITTQGISDIEIHVSRFGPSNANDVMISRLNQIKNGEIPITDYDKRFYTHELEEYARYKNMGQPTGVPSNADEATKLWNDTHTASLESYSVNEINQPLYHPSAQ